MEDNQVDPLDIPTIRVHIEDGIRTGHGMCIRMAELTIDELTKLGASQSQIDALSAFRDAMREMSAAFSLEAAGA